jgi:RNA-directed DNA polymerase
VGLKGGKRQKNQLQQVLAFPSGERGEAPKTEEEGTEPPLANRATESSAKGTDRLMEKVCERENCLRAIKHVRANRGSPGADDMTVKELRGYLIEHWVSIREQLLAGTYQPQPVMRVEIEKPDGGKRKLGIPVVVDRFIQQAVLQVLQPRWDPTFSEHSCGFRPGRSAHQAIGQAQEHIAAGNRWVVDIDLEKFFDRVNHDRLMSAVAGRVQDKRALKLLRGLLTAGVLENGLVSPTEEGTPQGGPLSPILSNLVLDELDRELQRRGLRFVRYADDCNIYVRSKRAAQRVMASITRFITTKLKLKVNQQKSAVGRPWQRKFLGFSFTSQRQPKRRIAPAARERFERKIRLLTRRTRGVSLQELIREVGSYMQGWRGYFGFCQTPSVLNELQQWVQRRIRAVAWKHWKRGTRRFQQLRRLGLSVKEAAPTAKSQRGPWRIANSLSLQWALSPAYLAGLGLPSLVGSYWLNPPNRRVRDPYAR